MQARTIILTALVGGPLAGIMLGMAADPTMVSLPQPAWRQAQPDAIFTRSQYLAEAGPQDLSPRWDSERVPTWKRRDAARQIAAATALQNAAYREDFPAPYFTGQEDRAEPAALLPDAAAAERSPAREAQEAVVTAVPAATEQDDPAAQAGG